jgi:hypothetical protein
VSIGIDERLVIGRGQRLASAQRPGAVSTDEHEPRPDESAVVRHEQLRSDLANETIRDSQNAQFAVISLNQRISGHLRNPQLGLAADALPE